MNDDEGTSVVSGVEHGRDSDSAGLRVLCQATGVCEEQRLLRVHQTSNRQIPNTGVWQVWWDCCKFKQQMSDNSHKVFWCLLNDVAVEKVMVTCKYLPDVGGGLPARKDCLWRVDPQWSGGQNVERPTPGGVPQHPKQEQCKGNTKEEEPVQNGSIVVLSITIDCLHYYLLNPAFMDKSKPFKNLTTKV